MILKEFKQPPSEYGEVSFFWWHGDDIEKEKLHWILEQLKEKHICGIQINYCHGDTGGQLYGLTMESNPRPFSEEWWELIGWFMTECKKYNMSVSLSDYTLGAPGQGFYVDEVLTEHPEYIGQRLIKKDGKVQIEKVPFSLNPMEKGVGDAIIEKFYGEFERHFPNECGEGINFFFSDELNFNIRGNLWSSSFSEEFLNRKGYSINEKWDALFEDIGEETAKIRLDYYDVIVQLSEESYFRPIYEWHESHHMTFGCDHGGRGRDVTEFGDYFRIMKWYQGPGNDQPHLASDIIKSKVSSSIAHLYQRPRVWLEGFYSSGWQTSPADIADAVFRNFGLGHNLLSLHGLYYSTHGSMWEWAPPCNHYHMPYWSEMGTLLECTKRLSYVMSQGVHRCDVAIVYPVAAMEVDRDQGKVAVETAFSAAQYLYENGIDFDFIDFESIVRAKIDEGKLHVSGEEYRYLILPDMKNVRYQMYEKVVEYADCGNVIVMGQYPVGSDYVEQNLRTLDSLTEQLQKSCYFCKTSEEVCTYIKNNGDLDFTYEEGIPFIHHRVIEDTNLYYLYGIKKGSKCSFRTTGIPIVYNPWTGERVRLRDYRQEGERTWIQMPVSEKESLILVFAKDEPEIAELPFVCQEYETVMDTDGEWMCEIEPTMDNQYGDYRLPAGNYFIGPEIRELEYCFTQELTETSEWKKERITFGTQFYMCNGNEKQENTFIQMSYPTEQFIPYVFSMKEGIKQDAGDQGSYHGLKGKLSDEFLAFGTKKIRKAGSSSEYMGQGIWYLFTTVYTEQEAYVTIDTGDMQPDCLWVNHKKVQGKECRLQQGTNTILLKYQHSGRTYFVLRKSNTFMQNIPLVTKWYKNTDIMLFDSYPQYSGKNCWYRFMTPPGAVGLRLVSIGETTVLVEGKEVTCKNNLYQFENKDGNAKEILIKIIQKRGYYGCAAIQEPISFVTGQGVLNVPINWEQDGLQFYSGGIRLRKKIEVKSQKNVLLKLKFEDCAVKVKVNGQEAGVILAPPYLCDITQFVHLGSNEVELLVHNTMYNHMKTIPTNFNFRKSPCGKLPYSLY